MRHITNSQINAVPELKLPVVRKKIIRECIAFYEVYLHTPTTIRVPGICQTLSSIINRRKKSDNILKYVTIQKIFRMRLKDACKFGAVNINEHWWPSYCYENRIKYLYYLLTIQDNKNI